MSTESSFFFCVDLEDDVDEFGVDALDLVPRRAPLLLPCECDRFPSSLPRMGSRVPLPFIDMAAYSVNVLKTNGARSVFPSSSSSRG